MVMACTKGISGDAARGAFVVYITRDGDDGSLTCDNISMLDFTHVVNYFIHHLASRYTAYVSRPAPISSVGLEMDRQREEAAKAKERTKAAQGREKK